MRLTTEQVQDIRQVVREQAGQAARVWLFGSRLDDGARGGDVDLLVSVADPTPQPALLAAGLSAHISKRLHGRQVDVVLQAPNLLELPIHRIALASGVEL
jgi:predicted nucleotidyltransferase